MDNFMNIPDLIPVTELNIIEEYRRNRDIGHVAKVFDITNAEVKRVLKQAGIQINKSRNKSENIDPLNDVGMSERDFYCDTKG